MIRASWRCRETSHPGVGLLLPFAPRGSTPPILICITLHRGDEEDQNLGVAWPSHGHSYPTMGRRRCIIDLDAWASWGVSAPFEVQEVAPPAPRRLWMRGKGEDLVGTRTGARVRWTHLEVAHGRGRVGEEALAEGDLQTSFLHPLVQVIEGLVAGG